MTKTSAAAALAILLMGSAAHANLVVNGDFEQSSYGQSNQFGTGFGGQGVTGWTGNGGYNLYFLAGTATTVAAHTQYGSAEKLYGPVAFASPDGGNFVALDGDQSAGIQGGISQTIGGLIAGHSYLLSFDWGAGQVQSRSGDTTEQLSASLGGQTFTTQVASNPSRSFTGWFHAAFTYTATGTSELLSFLSVGTPSGLPPIATLDGVSLVDVPEPVSLALLGGGLVGLGAVRRRAR